MKPGIYIGYLGAYIGIYNVTLDIILKLHYTYVYRIHSMR